MTGMINNNALVNRHMARLLSELEDAECPVIFRDAVKKELIWLRDDINGKVTKGNESYDDDDSKGNC